MKACKNCNFKFSGLELSSVVRYSALYDIFRLILLHGMMLMIFLGCANLAPKFPEDRETGRTIDYILYNGTRTNLTAVESAMLHNVQKVCGRGYRNALPEIWEGAREYLLLSIRYLSVAVVLPVFSAVAFLIVYKKDRTSSYIAVLHYVIEMIAITFGLYGAWFLSDRRFCFFGAFEKTFNIQAMVWTGALLSAFLQKLLILYSLRLYLLHHYKSHSLYFLPPTPEEELKLYLEELRSIGITPIVKTDPLPSDPEKVNFVALNNQIKKALKDVRLQVAKLYRDDPLIADLIDSGRLGKLLTRPGRMHGSTASDNVPGIMKILLPADPGSRHEFQE